MCTIVTGLFDIKRHDMDGRIWSSYLNWFEKTLSINCPMVIYVEEETVNFVKNKRKNLSTKIISQKIEDLYYFKHKEAGWRWSLAEFVSIFFFLTNGNKS